MQFDYQPGRFGISYNTKWTILKHVQFIVNDQELFNEEDFGDIAAGGRLPDNRLYDAVQQEYSQLPAFGCDYLGMRESDSGIREFDDIYQLVYRGKIITIEASAEFGIRSENRRLLEIHDTVFFNLRSASDSNMILIHNFSRPVADPEPVTYSISISRMESEFDATETFTRANGFRMTLFTALNSVG